MHGNLYATPKAPVLAALAAGEDVLFDIDWQGARQLKARHGATTWSRVFILPPDGKALERRLQDAHQDYRRGRGAAHGCGRRPRSSHWAEYDYVIVNADLDAEPCRPALPSSRPSG